jgi:hypothetical protein
MCQFFFLMKAKLDDGKYLGQYKCTCMHTFVQSVLLMNLIKDEDI